MASFGGGYDCEFVEKPPKIVQSECPVCLQILREPYQADCCGYAFCRVCIEQVKASNKPCPCCKAETFDKFEDKRLKRMLYEFKVYCTNKQHGCQWQGELRQLDNHLNCDPPQEKQLEGCRFTRVKCLYCSELVQRSSIQIHQSEQCSRRPFSCEYCKDFESTYEDVTTNHWPVCGYYPVQCTNRCETTIERQLLKSHISNDCPLTAIDCDFSHVGCKVKLPRKDMVFHVTQYVIKHVSLHAQAYKLMVNQLDQLTEENKQLKQQVDKLTQDLKLQQICTPICPATFTMTDFEEHKTNDRKWVSPSFYTHPKGYKMRVGIVANGSKRYEGTHTSVGIILMKGEFDDELKWPFQGSITIRLLSQENEDYYVAQIPFTNTAGNTAGRVLTEDSKIGRACLNFVSLTELRSKYLKNDCLKLCAYEYIKH